MGKYEKEQWGRESFRLNFRLPYEDFYEEHIPGVSLEEIETHFREGFAISSDEVPVLPHAEDFLKYLKGKENRMFVLTSMCSVAFSEQVSELGLEHFFEDTYAGVLDKREVIGALIKEQGLDPAKTIFVGDMTHDVETAHHGGVHSVGVLTGYNHREVLESVNPTLVMEDLKEFREVLIEQPNWTNLLTKKS